MNELHKSIRKKRNEYLLSIIEQFKESDENKSVFDCYDYVKTIVELTYEDFLINLTDEEKNLVEGNINKWFLPIETIRTFNVFLSSNQINF